MVSDIKTDFTHPWPKGPTIQWAEPFDGVKRSYLLTPALAAHFASQGFVNLHMVGRCSGPKYGNTLAEILAEMPEMVHELKSSKELPSQPPAGFVIEQQQLSAALDRWVDLRRMMIKRPFLATLEKFPNTFKSDIFIASAFHDNFSQKMMSLAQYAGFKYIIIVHKGREGTIGLSTAKPGLISYAKITKDGYDEGSFGFSTEDLGLEAMTDGRVEGDFKKNASLLKDYLERGQSPDEHFNMRVRVTVAALELAFERLGLVKKAA